MSFSAVEAEIWLIRWVFEIYCTCNLQKIDISENKKIKAIFWPKWPILGKIAQFWAFLRKTQNDCKKCVFRFYELRYSSFDVFSEYISYATYRKLISPKTKKLGRFFRKKCSKLDILAKNGAFLRKTKNDYKKCVFRF